MSIIHEKLESFIAKFQIDELSIDETTYTLLDLDKQFGGYVAILDLSNSKLIYFNSRALKYLGLQKNRFKKLSSFELFGKVIHPSNLELIVTGFKFLIKRPDKTFNSVAQIRKYDKSWDYIFFSARLLNHQPLNESSFALIYAVNCEDVFNSQFVESDIRKIGSNQKQPLLSQKEIQIIRLLGKEYTSKEIAEELFLSVLTVNAYRKGLIKKLKVKNSIGLVLKGIEMGWIVHS